MKRSYLVDVVLCVDLSERNTALTENLKVWFSELPHALAESFLRRGESLTQMRIRLVTRSALTSNSGSQKQRSFIPVFPKQDTHDLNNQLTLIRSNRLRGSSPATLACDFLENAMNSPWIDGRETGTYCRHIIAIFTDYASRPLGAVMDGNHDSPPSERLEQLTRLWDSRQTRLQWASKRLLLVAPDTYPWNIIGDSWAQTIWLPLDVDKADASLDFATLVSLVVNEI